MPLPSCLWEISGDFDFSRTMDQTGFFGLDFGFILTLIIKKRLQHAKKNLCLELLGFAGIYKVMGG
jgi:hypothetical protein